MNWDYEDYTLNELLRRVTMDTDHGEQDLFAAGVLRPYAEADVAATERYAAQRQAGERILRPRERFLEDPVSRAVDEEIRRRLVEKKVQEKLALIEAFGEDDWPEETIFKFRKMFTKDGKAYVYAVIKVNGLWYTTGPKSPKGYTWEEFVAWLTGGDVPVRFDELKRQFN